MDKAKPKWKVLGYVAYLSLRLLLQRNQQPPLRLGESSCLVFWPLGWLYVLPCSTLGTWCDMDPFSMNKRTQENKLFIWEKNIHMFVLKTDRRDRSYIDGKMGLGNILYYVAFIWILKCIKETCLLLRYSYVSWNYCTFLCKRTVLKRGSNFKLPCTQTLDMISWLHIGQTFTHPISRPGSSLYCGFFTIRHNHVKD